ncbi:MAG TPA: VOC family protein [Candidatus Limnocylindrales bacterium]|nr:VOC family protein [Candidatus Limnocylindrales bacterium]
MANVRMDHVGVIVDDLEAATDFFLELGLEREGDASVEGPWVDRVNGMDDVRVDIRMMRTPDGQGRLELTRFRSPAVGGTDDAPPNTRGLRSVMFVVDDVDEAVSRLRSHGADLIGEVVQYEDVYRLCYVRGPAGIIVALAQELG